MRRRRGHYFGTEIDRRWWKRCRQEGLFMRGTGEYWFDDEAFCFRRYLTRQPLVLPFRALAGYELGRWHAGQWGGGQPVVKFLWSNGEQPLSSGFILARTRPETDAILAELRARREAAMQNVS